MSNFRVGNRLFLQSISGVVAGVALGGRVGHWCEAIEGTKKRWKWWKNVEEACAVDVDGTAATAEVTAAYLQRVDSVHLAR